MLALNPNFVPALTLAAWTQERRKDHQAAQSLEERARKAAASGWQEAWLLAHQAMKKGRWREADEAYGKLIVLESSGTEAYLGSSFVTRLGRGMARLEAKDYLGAIGDFSVAEARWPESPEPIIHLGRAYHRLGKKDEAEALFLKLHLESPPDSRDEIAAVISSVYDWFLGEPERQLDWLKRVNDDFLRDTLQIGVFWGLGRLAEAAEAGKRAIAHKKNTEWPYIQLAFIYSELEKYADSIQLLEEAIRLKPTSIPARFQRAMTY